jgi:hypothetical protein
LPLWAARLTRFSSTLKRIIGFSDFLLSDICFTYTTKAFTQDLTRLKGGWMKSGSVSPLNIDGLRLNPRVTPLRTSHMKSVAAHRVQGTGFHADCH